MNILHTQGIVCSEQKRTKVYIYSFADIMKYMDVVGSHNPKNLQRIVDTRTSP